MLALRIALSPEGTSSSSLHPPSSVELPERSELIEDASDVCVVLLLMLLLSLLSKDLTLPSFRELACARVDESALWKVVGGGIRREECDELARDIGLPSFDSPSTSPGRLVSSSSSPVLSSLRIGAKIFFFMLLTFFKLGLAGILKSYTIEQDYRMSRKPS